MVVVRSWEKFVPALALHLICFIRDAALKRLVVSLKFYLILTRSVSYLSLILCTSFYSLLPDPKQYNP